MTGQNPKVLPTEISCQHPKAFCTLNNGTQSRQRNQPRLDSPSSSEGLSVHEETFILEGLSEQSFPLDGLSFLKQTFPLVVVSAYGSSGFAKILIIIIRSNEYRLINRPRPLCQKVTKIARKAYCSKRWMDSN